MGSFYGTTFKELKDTFKKLIVKKKNNTEIKVEAKGTEDSITFNEKDKVQEIDNALSKIQDENIDVSECIFKALQYLNRK